MTLRDTIAQLEKAAGPDRELDLAIMAHISGKPWRWHRSFPDKTVVTWDQYGTHANGNPVCSLEAFTGSIDDATALVPKGMFYSLRTSEGPTVARVGGSRIEWFMRGGEHTSPAIALCIAALKARAALGDEQSDQKREPR